jgi:DNA-directed RNA polymerase specialized sigma24 family protein
MSPLSVRRYRAERLLRRDFEALRGRVLTTVRSKLSGGGGATLDTSDLEACYALAWQGLYAAVLEGEEIANPTGWLVLVTFRRAVDEQRARGRAHRGGERVQVEAGGDPIAEAEIEMGGTQARDLADELDDRVRLRQLFEGLRGRLSEREREAAVLCYLHGLSRSQAAARMGVSDARMRKLMEGSGAGRPGVAGKVGHLVASIRDGEWCEEQGSLMRALAYGILDPDGERYRLALCHRSECPACRAYVASLRGLAATLPPVFLPRGVGAAAVARAARGAHAGTVGGASGVGGSGTAGGVQAGGGMTGALSASGAASAGAGGVAGGGWLLTGGSLTAKLAAGCVLAFSVGASCVALNVDIASSHRHGHAHPSTHAVAADAGEHQPVLQIQSPPVGTSAGRHVVLPHEAHSAAESAALTPERKASREFGPEQAIAAGEGSQAAAVAPSTSTARAASSGSASETVTDSAGPAVDAASSAGEVGSGSGAEGTDSSKAEREFAPG